MKLVPYEKLPLLQPWLNWAQLPESVRERALDVLTTLCLEIVSQQPVALEPNDHDQLDH
jgi:hypothetical protein